MFLDLDTLYAPVLFEGEDAEAFLQRQLTCDLKRLDPATPLPGAWLNAKGRVLATLFLVRTGPTRVLALTERPQVDALVTGLSRYVLRDKVRIGLSPDHVSGLLPGAGNVSPSHRCWPWPGDRWIRIDTAAGHDDSARLQRWQRIDIALKRAYLSSGSEGRHLPQALALDAGGAVSFDKGCYPGQEIVARTHYLGKVKRQLVAIGGRGSPPAAGPLTARDGSGHGDLVQSAPLDGDGWIGLAVIPESALDGVWSDAKGQTVTRIGDSAEILAAATENDVD